MLPESTVLLNVGTRCSRLWSLAIALAVVTSAGLAPESLAANPVMRWVVAERAIAAEANAMAITTPQDAVDRFEAETQLYIQGSPLGSEEVTRLRSLLSQNPNIYVVLLENSSDVVADDLLLSRGIGESDAFRSRYNAALDQRDGVLFMVYFDSDQGRKIFMRSEELPDRLGVGEANFADSSGQPRELLTLFVNAVRNEGKDVPAALGVVIQRINGTIQAAAQSHSASASPSGSAAVQPQPAAGTSVADTVVADTVATDTTVVREGGGDRDASPWLGAALILSSLAPAGMLNYKARQRKKQAQQQWEETRQNIDQKTQSLMALIERSDYAILRQYEGHTQQLSEQLGEDLGDALALLGGAAKFVDEAGQLIQGLGLGKMLRCVGFDRAIALLTDPETKLSFDLNDSTRTVFEKDSNAEVWRTTLLKQENAQGKSRSFEKSLQEILEALAENQTAAAARLAEIQTKAAGIEGFLERVETEAAQQLSQLQRLKEGLKEELQEGLQEGTQAASRPEQPFVLQSLMSQTLPSLLDPTEGLIAQGRQQMAKDPVRVWSEFGETAQRITAKATTLLEQDRERREVCPGLMEKAAGAIATHRPGLFAQLQQQNAFLQGQPEQLLREPEQDPSDRVQQAQQEFQQLLVGLSQEDTVAAASHLTAIKTLTQAAHQICQSTEAALQAHRRTLQQHQAEHGAILQRLEANFRPILTRLLSRYRASAFAQVAAEVESGTTITDNIDNAQNLLAQAQQRLHDAAAEFDRAYILTAADRLAEADRLLQGSQKQLEALRAAEVRLDGLQDEVTSGLQTAEVQQESLMQTAQADYLRSPARTALEQATTALDQARRCAQTAPPDPYATQAALKNYETQRAVAIAAAEQDKRAYEAAVTELKRAEGAIASAQTQISQAQRQSFTYATVSTHSARQKLRQAEQIFEQAHQLMDRGDYEQTSQQADQASSTANRASRMAEEAVRSARRSHDAEVARRREEAARLAAQAASSSWSSSSSNSSSYSSSSDSSSSSSDSGSTGGSW